MPQVSPPPQPDMILHPFTQPPVMVGAQVGDFMGTIIVTKKCTEMGATEARGAILCTLATLDFPWTFLHPILESDLTR